MSYNPEMTLHNNPILLNLYKEFTCTICLNLFKDPVTVSQCKHTYCQDCLKQWKFKSDHANGSSFKCPLCKNVTASRSYYSNEKSAKVVEFLHELSSYMESSRDTNENSSVLSFHQYEYRKVILRNYLNECIKYKLDYENEGPEVEVQIDVTNKNNTITNNKENINTNGDVAGSDASGNGDNAILITESEENEYILDICPTAENINIIKKLEEDFLEDLEKEGNNKDEKMAKKRKVNDETHPSTSTVNKADSPTKKTGWTRMKTINRDVTKKVGKYRRLKVKEIKPKTETAEKRRSATKSSKNQTILGDFDEYVEETSKPIQNITEAPIVISTSSEKSFAIVDDEDGDKQDNDDDIFLRSTQILSLDSLNPEVSIIKLGKRKSSDNVSSEGTTVKKQKSPDKINDTEQNVIVVSADVHHSNDSVVNLPIRTESTELLGADIIENSEEHTKVARTSKTRAKVKPAAPKENTKTKTKSIAAKEKTPQSPKTKPKSTLTEENIKIPQSPKPKLRSASSIEDNMKTPKTKSIAAEENIKTPKSPKTKTRSALTDLKTPKVKSIAAEEKTPKSPKTKSALTEENIKTPQSPKAKLRSASSSEENMKTPKVKAIVAEEKTPKSPKTRSALTEKNIKTPKTRSIAAEENKKTPNSPKIKAKPVSNEEIKTIPKCTSAEDVYLFNLNKELKENLQKVSELKSSVLQGFEQNLKESDNIMSEYSNYVYNSDSLFSSESPDKKHPETNETKLKRLNNVCSAPTLDNAASRESITFYNTAIPCLEKIKGYYQQLKALTDQFTQYSSVTELKSSANKVFANIETQTDILKCPTCTYTFNLKPATEIPRKKSQSSDSSIHQKKTSNAPIKDSDPNSEEFKAFLENVKINLSEKQTKDSLPKIPEDNVSLDDTKKKRFKRIRAPTDSDSDESSENSKKSRSSSYQNKLYRDDIDVCFNSSTSQMYSNIEDQAKKSNNLETNKEAVLVETTPAKNSKSSEDTLLYLEQQYKNPIDLPLNSSVKAVPEKCAINTNLDNLFAGIDVSTFENDFSIGNKNDSLTETHQNQKTELSASLFTETQVNKLNISLNNNQKVSHEPNKVAENNAMDGNNVTVEDSYESDDIFEDDIVDTTPQKINDHSRLNTTEYNKNETKCNTSESKCLTGNSQLELRKLQIENPPKITTNTNITSMTPDFLPLSNIDLNCGFFDNSKFLTKSQTTQPQQPTQNLEQVNVEKSLKPILLIQNEEFSPLQLIKQPNPVSQKKPEPLKHQSSILSYVSPRQTQPTVTAVTNDIDERCQSPVLHARPSPAAAAAAAPIILCTSRLQSKENADVMTYAPRLNARYTNVFNENVTHLIVKVDENNCVVDQTIKYVLAIAHGIWIVSYAWFKTSLHKNRLLPEESYEVLDMSGIPGPRLSRLRRRDSPIFKDFIFYIADPVATASRADLEDVIVNLGGEVIQSPNDFSKYRTKHCLILSEGKCCENVDQYEIFKNKYQIMAVDIEWLSETVGQYKITSVRPYTLCSDENIENYGYPLELIAPIPESLIDESGYDV